MQFFSPETRNTFLFLSALFDELFNREYIVLYARSTSNNSCTSCSCDIVFNSAVQLCCLATTLYPYPFNSHMWGVSEVGSIDI